MNDLLSKEWRLGTRIWLLVLGWLGCMGVARAQYTMGTTGLLNIPTAEMRKPGTFMIGGNYLPEEMHPFNYNTGNYFVNITFLSFLELNYRCQLLKTPDKSGKRRYIQQDRSMSARLRPIKEGRYMPAVVIGTNDPFKDMGNNYFASVYGVLTKHFTMGGHTISASVGYFHPLDDDGASLQDGLFGGVSYTPSFCKELKVIVEYDSQKVNAGAAVKLWKHVSVHAFTHGGNCISGGMRYECTLIH